MPAMLTTVFVLSKNLFWGRNPRLEKWRTWRHDNKCEKLGIARAGEKNLHAPSVPILRGKMYLVANLQRLIEPCEVESGLHSCTTK